MGLLALTSAKGSPGVTTAGLVIAALWPRPVLLADCDPAGGDVALRMPGPDGTPLDRERGLLSLAAAGRRGGVGGPADAHVQQVTGGLDVLAGVRGPDQAQAIGDLWNGFGPLLRDGPDVVADCGRVGTASPQVPLLAAADLVVFVCRPEVAAVVHLRERLGALLPRLNGRAGVLVVAAAGDIRGVDGVRGVLTAAHPDVPLIGQLAFDPAGARAFTGDPGRRVDRSLLVRSARPIAAGLAARVSRVTALPNGTA